MTLVCALAVNTETSDEALVSSVHLPELELSAFFFKHAITKPHSDQAQGLIIIGSDSDKYNGDFLIKLNEKL